MVYSSTLQLSSCIRIDQFSINAVATMDPHLLAHVFVTLVTQLVLIEGKSSFHLMDMLSYDTSRLKDSQDSARNNIDVIPQPRTPEWIGKTESEEYVELAKNGDFPEIDISPMNTEVSERRVKRREPKSLQDIFKKAYRTPGMYNVYRSD